AVTCDHSLNSRLGCSTERCDLLRRSSSRSLPLTVLRGPQVVAALDDETRDWVLGLRNHAGGPCCDTADSFPVEVDGWDMAGIVDDTSGMAPLEASNARSGYRVRLRDGKWHDVPNFALIDPNFQWASDGLRRCTKL